MFSWNVYYVSPLFLLLVLGVSTTFQHNNEKFRSIKAGTGKGMELGEIPNVPKKTSLLQTAKYKSSHDYHKTREFQKGKHNYVMEIILELDETAF